MSSPFKNFNQRSETFTENRKILDGLNMKKMNSSSIEEDAGGKLNEIEEEEELMDVHLDYNQTRQDRIKSLHESHKLSFSPQIDE